MRLDTNTQAAHTVAKLAEDVWHSRRKILHPDRPILYLPYRLSITDRATDVDHNTYVHYVVEAERWYYTFSDAAPWGIDHNTLRFREDSNNPEWPIRAVSWRHYAFSDLLSCYLEKHLDAISARMQDPTAPYLWGTFPIEAFTGTSVMEPMG